MKRIIVIAGPTASNKSRIAIDVASRFDGEIINADSRQFFKYMLVGTASPSERDRKLIPHHLYNIFEPNFKINAGLFIRLADERIDDIIQRGKIPVLVGGTGLYLKSLIRGIADIPEIPAETTQSVKETIREKGLKYCYDLLKSIDPEYTNKISPSDTQRIERALEVFYATGERFSAFHNRHNFKQKRYDDISITIMPPREILYQRINDRTREIFNSGIIEETRYLLQNGYADSQALDAIGYQEALRYINDRIPLQMAIEETSQRTRNYAKRQITWFRKFEAIQCKSIEDIEGIIDIISKRLRDA